MEDATFSWLASSKDLSGLNFTVAEGEMVCVIGETGSGKSSVIAAVLGEMTRTQGEANIRGTVAYVSQQPWIFKGTIRENILFGKPFDPQVQTPGLLLTTRHHSGGGGGSHTTLLDPTPPFFKKLGQILFRAFSQSKNFLWRLRRQSV